MDAWRIDEMGEPYRDGVYGGGGASATTPGTSPSVLDQLGFDDSTGGRIVLPESYYPCSVQLAGFDLTKNLPGGQVPELQLHLTVIEGPYAGTEVGKYDSSLLLSSGREDDEKQPGRDIGRVNHMVKAVTGQPPDAGAFGPSGFTFTGNPATTREEFHRQFVALDGEAKRGFMATYARIKAWDGKQAIVYLRVREYQDAEGKTRYSNRIGNFFGVNDAKHGLAWVRKVAFPVQERAAAAPVSE